MSGWAPADSVRIRVTRDYCPRDFLASWNASMDANIRRRKKRRARLLLLAAIALGAAFVLFGCGASARQRAIRDTFVGVNVARASFVSWDANHQNVIVDSCVADGNEEAECERRLLVYRADRAVVVEAFTFAYRALAAAALDSHTPLPVVLGVVTDLGAAIVKLKGAL